MSQITITINSREYPIACEDGQELRIMQLADIVDTKAKLLASGANQVSESLLLAMVGLLLADELSELKKNNTDKEYVAASSDLNHEEILKIDGEVASVVYDIDNEIKKLANQLKML